MKTSDFCSGNRLELGRYALLADSEPGSFRGSTPSRSLTFRCGPSVHAVDLDPGGAGWASLRCAARRAHLRGHTRDPRTIRYCLRCCIVARPPRNYMFVGARYLRACRTTACTVSVYASRGTSRCPTQDSIRRPGGTSADGTRLGGCPPAAPAGQQQLRDAHRSTLLPRAGASKVALDPLRVCAIHAAVARERSVAGRETVGLRPGPSPGSPRARSGGGISGTNLYAP